MTNINLGFSMNKKTVISILGSLSLGLSSTVFADQAFDPKGQYFFGDWNGKRTELAEKGIKFDANIGLDVAYLADGGRNSGAAPTYASQLWLGSTFDMSKLAGWDDTVIRAIGEQMGVGGDDSWGANVHPEYIPDVTKPVEFTFTFRGI